MEIDRRNDSPISEPKRSLQIRGQILSGRASWKLSTADSGVFSHMLETRDQRQNPGRLEEPSREKRSNYLNNSGSESLLKPPGRFQIQRRALLVSQIVPTQAFVDRRTRRAHRVPGTSRLAISKF